MKFRIAVTVSIIFHFSLFAIAYLFPGFNKGSGTTYYVDLINVNGGNNFNASVNEGKSNKSKKENVSLEEDNKVKNLTVKKELKSKLRFPDKKSKKKKEITKDTDSLISVVRKKKRKVQKNDSSISNVKKKGILKTGISGSGYGSGTGGVQGNFPYGYYIDTLKNRISSSWYNPLASSGIKGSYNTVVYFRIFRDGSIGNLKVVQRSGKQTFDMSAERVIREVSPFPPLPSDYPEYYLGVYFEFEWKK